jgi:hypothetical protein
MFVDVALVALSLHTGIPLATTVSVRSRAKDPERREVRR